MIKYRIPYFDERNRPWRVDISNEAYVGNIVQLNTLEGQACEITYQRNEDILEPVISSSVNFTILKHNGGLIDVSELKNAGDKEWSVDVYLQGGLYWTGWLIPDGIQEYLHSLPYDIQLSATDGLKLLKNTAYSTNNWPLPEGVDQRSFIAHIRNCLIKGDQNNKRLPLRWIGNLQQYRFPDDNRDAFTECTFSPRGEGYQDFNGNRYSSYYIMENLLRSHQCRLYQAGGRWIVERIPDIMEGVYEWNEISPEFNSVDVPTLTTGTETKIYPVEVMMPGGYTLNMPGVKRVTVTYEAPQPENVLPNGSFDASIFAPRQWYPDIPEVEVDDVAGLNDRKGNALQITFPAGNPNLDRAAKFSMRSGVGLERNYLPIDSTVIFKRMSFGFTLMPLNGFPYDNDGNIDWGTRPFNFIVSLISVGDSIKKFVLTENGFWIPEPTGEQFNRTSSNQVAESGTVNRYETTYAGNAIVGDFISYRVRTADVEFKKIYVPYSYSNDMAGYLDYVGRTIMAQDGPGKGSQEVLSYNVSGNTLIIRNKLYPDGSLTQFVMQWGASNTGRDGAIALLPGSSRIGDAIQVNFDKFQGIKLPDFDSEPGHKYTGINILFYVKEGQRYTLDDVYVTLDENSEVYDYEYGSSKFTDSLEYNIKISSSINGIFTSNIMDGYTTAPKDAPYVDSSGYIGNLTDLTARTAARLRSKSLEMVECGFYSSPVPFGGVYTLQSIPGKKFLPVAFSHNTETATIQMSCVEMHWGNADFSRKYYGENDRPLSNEVIN